MRRPSVIVFGAGLTGLAAAWRLAGAGAEVVIVEALDHVGGLAASFTWRGFSLDIGPHKLYPRARGIKPVLESLLGTDLLKHKKQAGIWYGGGRISFPPSIRSGFGHIGLGLAGLGSYMGSFLKARATAEVSYEDYMVARFGRQLYKRVLRPQAFKIWGPPDQLSAELARIRMPFNSLFDVMAGALIRSRSGPEVNAKEFYYPKQGIGELSRRLAAEISTAGGRIILGDKPIAIEHSKDGINVSLNKHSFRADILVSTIDPNSLLGVIDPAPPPEISQAARKLKFRSLILCYLALDRPRMGTDHWLVFPEKRYCFNRVYEAKSFGMGSGAPNETVVAAEVTVDPDQLWLVGDDEIFRQVVEGLEATGLIKEGDILDYKIVRIKRAYPLLDLGYADRRRRVLTYIHDQGNILCAGRSGLFIYNNMDHSLAMGLAAADHILLGSINSWPAAVERFENCRIID